MKYEDLTAVYAGSKGWMNVLTTKRSKKKAMDQRLLADIKRMKSEWETLENIMEHSIEPSEEGLLDLSVAKAKYFYLLREARHRNITAFSK
ncbi:YaaL family protein [Halobacillus seohaensis]|uniref:YaaL family protein n=1 Tax=Halobacillus seohaensis TaxID=447421 RepID=UPI0036F391B5